MACSNDNTLYYSKAQFTYIWDYFNEYKYEKITDIEGYLGRKVVSHLFVSEPSKWFLASNILLALIS